MIRRVFVDQREWSDGEMREYATFARDQHDPSKQEGNGYNRCEHCHYTRHPCDVYDLAVMVLALLDA